jgi:hypothetical protein
MQRKSKRRHWCLATWLVITIVGCTVSAFNAHAYIEAERAAHHTVPEWIFWPRTAACVGFVISAIGIFFWKKWGFWLGLGSGVAVFVISLFCGHSISYAIGAFFTPIVTFAVLWFCGKPNGWSQLE